MRGFCLKLFACIRQNADERIVVRVQDQRGHCDAIKHLRRGRARVVVLGIAKAAVARCYLIVEVAQAAKARAGSGCRSAQDTAPPSAGCACFRPSRNRHS